MDHTSKWFDGCIVSSDMIWLWNLDIGNLRPQVAIKSGLQMTFCVPRPDGRGSKLLSLRKIEGR